MVNDFSFFLYSKLGVVGENKMEYQIKIEKNPNGQPVITEYRENKKLKNPELATSEEGKTLINKGIELMGDHKFETLEVKVTFE